MNQINVSNNLIGRFYFKKTQNGNLLGEFSNNRSLSNSTESADVIISIENFVGEFISTWHQDGEAIFTKLIIEHKPNTGNSMFLLKWVSQNGNLMFLGEGFLFDGVLIGDYRDFEIV